MGSRDQVQTQSQREPSTAPSALRQRSSNHHLIFSTDGFHEPKPPHVQRLRPTVSSTHLSPPHHPNRPPTQLLTLQHPTLPLICRHDSNTSIPLNFESLAFIPQILLSTLLIPSLPPASTSFNHARTNTRLRHIQQSLHITVLSLVSDIPASLPALVIHALTQPRVGIYSSLLMDPEPKHYGCSKDINLNSWGAVHSYLDYGSQACYSSLLIVGLLASLSATSLRGLREK